MGISRDAKYHVLAVDDSLLDRKIIERLLKASSCQVTLVDSGNKALELLGLQDDKRGSQPSSQQEIGVNLIITDYCMPGMTGYDLLKRIKESAYLKDIPVVVMSSENVPSRINRCLEEGAEEFLLKPVKLSDMKKLRPHLLKGKSSSQEHEPNPKNPLQEVQDLIQQQQQPQSQSLPKAGKNNKRKMMEGGRISPERTRASYKDYGLTAMV